MNPIDDIVVEINEIAFFKICIKKTTLPINIDFAKNDKVIKIDSNKYNLCTDESEYIYTYSINECSIDDAGQYSFIVSNMFGKTVMPVRLLVKCNDY